MYHMLYVLCLYVSCVIVIGDALKVKYNTIPGGRVHASTYLEMPSSTFGSTSYYSRSRVKMKLSMSSNTIEGNRNLGNYDSKNDRETGTNGLSRSNDGAANNNLCADTEKVVKEVVSKKVAREVSTLNVCVGYRDLQPEDWFSKPENALRNSVMSKIDLLYDSECPICMMEVNFLQKRDIHERIRFTDLSDPSYNPAEHGNVQFADGMRKLRAVMPNGRVITGMEVFRETYEAIGLGWVFHLTRMPIIHELADTVYDLWAENRLRITGRPDLADLLKERQAALEKAEPIDECDLDACGIDFDDLEAELSEKGL